MKHMLNLPLHGRWTVLIHLFNYDLGWVQLWSIEAHPNGGLHSKHMLKFANLVTTPLKLIYFTQRTLIALLNVFIRGPGLLVIRFYSCIRRLLGLRLFSTGGSTIGFRGTSFLLPNSSFELLISPRLKCVEKR